MNNPDYCIICQTSGNISWDDGLCYSEFCKKRRWKKAMAELNDPLTVPEIMDEVISKLENRNESN